MDEFIYVIIFLAVLAVVPLMLGAIAGILVGSYRATLTFLRQGKHD